MEIKDKMEKLGYEQSRLNPWEYYKRYNGYISQVIDFSTLNETENIYEIDSAYIEVNDTISAQQCIDSIQDAFNILQEDFKELMRLLPEIKWEIWEN